MINNKKFSLDNKRCIKMFTIILTIAVVINIILFPVTCIYVIKKKIIILIGLSIILLFLLSKLLKLKFFKIESSGMVFGFSSYSILRTGWIVPVIEFPLEALEDFSLKKNILYIKIRKHDTTFSEVKLNLQCLHKSQAEKLRNNLEMIVGLNNT